MLPTPTSVFWSSRAALIGVLRPLRRAASAAPSKLSSRGSGPRPLNALCLETPSVATSSIRPKRRASLKRTCQPSSSSKTTWSWRSNGCSAALLASCRVMRPDMPRWTIRVWPLSSRISRYLARRSMPAIVRPSTFWANFAGSGTRRSRRRWCSFVMRWPTMRGIRPRRTVSTSGSSGMKRRTAAEQGAADAHVRGAQLHGGLVVGAHAHADLLQAVACGHLGQQREMQGGFFVDRRDAHQPDDRQLVSVAAGGDEGIEVGRQHACLLWFFAGVDLDEAGGALAGLLHLLGQGRGEAVAVDRLDDVEQSHGIARLVGLQRADQMKLEVGILGLERGEFLFRLLDAVLAEHALADGEQFADPVGAVRLGHGDQDRVGRRAAGGAGGRVDAGLHV